MTPQDLLANFETLAEAPNGIQRLRELVLELAVRGKLVEQDPAEEAASRLLKKAKSERARLEESGEARRGRDLPPPESVNQAFPAPPGWVWTRLGSLLLSDLGGGTPSKQVSRYWDGPIPWASVKDIGKRKFIDDTVDHISQEGLSDSASNLIQPQALLVCVRMGLGKVSINTVPMAINQDVRALCPSSAVLIDYLYNYLKITSLEGSGMTVKGIKREELLRMPICLPPVEEQRRIVARVDELMALLDRLEAKRQDREAARTAARDSALAALREAPTPDDVETAWLRIQERFGELFVAPESLLQLRQALLELAIKGVLLPQDPNDDDASRVLELIRSEFVTPKPNSKNSETQSTGKCQTPYPLPSKWKCLSARDLCRPDTTITYGVLKPVWVRDGVPTVRVQDIQGGEIIVDGIGQCSPSRVDKFLKTKLEPGDLLIAKDGATLGKTAFVPTCLEGGNITQHVLRFPINRHVNRRFVRLVVDSPYGQAWMKSETKGVALPGVNVGDFRRLPIPVPPIAEQQRIVEKVNDLISMIVCLSEGLRLSDDLQNAFASASVHHLEF